MKRPLIFIVFLINVIIFLSLVQVVVSNRLSTSGVLLGRLETQIDGYDKENYVLSEKLFTIASLTEIASKAATIGFAKEKSIVYINGSMPLAKR